MGTLRAKHHPTEIEDKGTHPAGSVSGNMNPKRERGGTNARAASDSRHPSLARLVDMGSGEPPSRGLQPLVFRARNASVPAALSNCANSSFGSEF